MDLADAHLAALEYLESGGESGAFNLGTGVGHSVDEVIRACEAVTGREIPVVYGPRREGDPARLVASPRLAQERLGWKATRSSLDRITADAWEARRASPTVRADEPGGVLRSARPHDEENAHVR